MIFHNPLFGDLPSSLEYGLGIYGGPAHLSAKFCRSFRVLSSGKRFRLVATTFLTQSGPDPPVFLRAFEIDHSSLLVNPLR